MKDRARLAYNFCMKKILLFLLIIFPISANAFTRVQFLGIVGMITISDRIANQVVDDDPEKLYNLMNVEIKEEFLGKGKAIKFQDNSFSWICAIRPSGETVCTIMIKSGPNAIISKQNQYIRFEVHGVKAKELHEKLFLNENNEFNYQTSDAYFHIESNGNTFVAEYTTKP